MNDIDAIQAVLDKYDAQIVYWTPVPQTPDELRGFMLKERISYLQNVLVKTLFDDGSGCVDISMIFPKGTGDGGFEPAWSMSDYAKKHNMRVTHFMKLPAPPIETTAGK